MDKNKIKAMLIERGIKHKDIAERLGVTRACVSLIVNGHQNSKRVRRAIAEALGVELADLWPQGSKES
jgi:predicted transcriptional regulator